MDDPILWTPWRMPYLRGEDRQHYAGCLFCVKGRGNAADPGFDAREYVVARSEHVYATLNMYPYNNGHLLIVPYEHVPSLERLPPDTLADLMRVTNQALGALRDIYRPQAFNIGANIGADAGAGIPDHFHLHIVPRWNADTGYMTVIGGARTIPDMLSDTWRRLRVVWIAPSWRGARQGEEQGTLAENKPKPLICPNCGHENNLNATRCAKCDLLLPATIPVSDLRPSERPAIPMEGFGMAGQPLTGSTLVLTVAGYPKPIYVRRQPEIALGRSAPGEPPPPVDLRRYRAQLMGVSRRHAVIRCADAGCSIEDLGSVNGTFLNEQQLNPHEPHSLKIGDHVRLGHLNMSITCTSIDSIILTNTGNDTVAQLSPAFLTEKLGPYLRALADMQDMINALAGGGGRGAVTIHGISPNADGAINIRLSDATEATEVLRNQVTPWRRRYVELIGQMQGAGDSEAVQTRFNNAITLLIQDVFKRVAPNHSADTLGAYHKKLREALQVLILSALQISDAPVIEEEDTDEDRPTATTTLMQ